MSRPQQPKTLRRDANPALSSPRRAPLSRNLRTLEADGLVEIAMVETDLRRRMVWLTETGARRLEKAIPIWRAANAKLAKCVSLDLARQLAEEAEALLPD